MHEIKHVTEALEITRLNASIALDNEALTEFARTWRGMPWAKWLLKRQELRGAITEFIALPPDQWPQRWPDRLARTTLALAAWQLSMELSLLLEDLRDADKLRVRFDPEAPRKLASESVLALLVAELVDVRWPADLGSPFQE